MRHILNNWLERHQHPVSFWLHMFGIPMTVVGVAVLIAGRPWLGVGLFVLGYAVQFLGHAIEGNDAGELILFKKWLGMPYIAVVPRSNAGRERSHR